MLTGQSSTAIHLPQNGGQNRNELCEKNSGIIDKLNVDLLRSVKMIGEIRIIIETSRGVSMSALNARLISKRSGDKAIGFGITSNSLREFSSRLSGDMDQLLIYIGDLVSEVADYIKEEVRNIVMRRAMISMGEWINEHVCIAMNNSFIQRNLRISKHTQVIDRSVLSSIKLCESGIAVARNALIESAYAGEITASLRQVSIEIGEAIDGIVSRLNEIRNVIQERS